VWQDIGRPDLRPDREFELINFLHEWDFDVALAFTSFSQSPHPAAFVCGMAGIPRFFGQSREAAPPIIPASPFELNQAERNLFLLESLGCSVEDRRLAVRIPHSAEESLAELARDSGLDLNQDFLLLNPWTSCDSRTYPPERFAEAARILSQRSGFPVVVSGSRREREKSGPVFEVLGSEAINLVGQTDVCQFAALVAHSRVVLTGNTSALHLADATGVPVALIYKAFNHGYYPVYILGSPRMDVGLLYSQPFGILVILLYIALGHLFYRDALFVGFSYKLVVNIGKILHELYLIAPV
jgi:ADP-heptose:LPS heptosyltransferase